MEHKITYGLLQKMDSLNCCQQLSENRGVPAHRLIVWGGMTIIITGSICSWPKGCISAWGYRVLPIADETKALTKDELEKLVDLGQRERSYTGMAVVIGGKKYVMGDKFKFTSVQDKENSDQQLKLF